MAKFKNIKNVESRPYLTTPPVAKPSVVVTLPKDEPFKKTKESVRVVEQKKEAARKTVKTEVRPTAAIRVKKETKKVSSLGKSVIVLTLVVVVQIVLLVSLIYLTPTLLK